MKESSVRLQWDPDHDPYGNKLERKAIQIGVRHKEIELYSRKDILEIEDVSTFVAEQHQFVLSKNLEALEIPYEKPLLFKDEALNEKLYLQT